MPRRTARQLTEQSRWQIARQIKSLRGTLSQEEFAKKLGMPRTSISRLENGRRGTISLSTLLRIAAKLDIHLVVQFDGKKKFARKNATPTRAFARPRLGRPPADAAVTVRVN